MKKITIALLLFTILGCNTKTTNVKENGTNAVLDLEIRTELNEDSFDINSIPISDYEVSDVIFFELPVGYLYNRPKNVIDYDQFAFFVSTDKYVFKEGKLFQSRITTDENKIFSLIELLRNIENVVVKQFNGSKVFEGKANRESISELNEKIQMYNYDGYGFIGYTESYVYLIRNNNKETWIHIAKTDDNASAEIGILQTKPLEITAKIKKASEIEDELNKTGKSILYINFETNKSDLNTESIKLIDQIVKVMNDNSSFKISIEGHTDNNGTIEHNQNLSENRAKSVKEELIKKDISSERLQSRGFGQTKPLIENNSEENKAKNRRVELIRIK